MQQMSIYLFLLGFISLYLWAQASPTSEEDSAWSNNVLEEEMPTIKRHVDGLFTHSYSRYRNKMAILKYLKSVLPGTKSEVKKPKA
uniref:VIP-like peptide isoform 5 VLP5 n=1 Tax=Desmognathus ocoee TaxID=179530 RepID=A0A0H4A7J2_9SALA|nr:VIP-like peptide isoform 5 VLP5 [Desmognathus ocoee]